ncbi:hypothetical protein LDO31_03040 [Luteimonas sp. XNQY3]|nr:hypothetical protein [Luteimonas sp. XNQY3]MCD9005223.1 hypothetical protein [Luteimonas sp. XNQY3]
MSKVEIEKRGRVVRVHSRVADVLVARGGYLRRDMVAAAPQAVPAQPAAKPEAPKAAPAKKAAKAAQPAAKPEASK